MASFHGLTNDLWIFAAPTWLDGLLNRKATPVLTCALLTVPGYKREVTARPLGPPSCLRGYFRSMSLRNSVRVWGWVRKSPSISLVSARVFCFSTPRIIMQR